MPPPVFTGGGEDRRGDQVLGDVICQPEGDINIWYSVRWTMDVGNELPTSFMFQTNEIYAKYIHRLLGADTVRRRSSPPAIFDETNA